MRRDLPTRPSLEHLKKQAKDLLDAHRRGDEEGLARIRAAVPSFAAMSDEELARAPFALHDAQSAIAREYGTEELERAARGGGLESGEPATLRGAAPRRSSASRSPKRLPPRWETRGRAAPRPSRRRRRPSRTRCRSWRCATRSSSPRALTPIHVGRAGSKAAVEAALARKPTTLAVFSQRTAAAEDVDAGSLHPVGCEAIVYARIPDGERAWVVLEGVRWLAIESIEAAPQGHQVARVKAVRVEPGDDSEVSALADTLRERARPLAGALPGGSRLVAMIDDLEAEPLADLVIANLPVAVDREGALRVRAEALRAAPHRHGAHGGSRCLRKRAALGAKSRRCGIGSRRCDLGHRSALPRRIRPAPRRPDPRGSRRRAGRGRAARSVRRRRPAMGRRRAREPRGLDLLHGAEQGDRPCAKARHGGRSRRGARRPRGRPQRRAVPGGPAAPALHVLSPCARTGRADRSDPPDALGTLDGGDCARVPRVADHDGAAARSREVEDPRRRHPLRGPGRRRPRRAARRRDGGDLPRLQRGLQRDLRRGARASRSVRGGDPPRPPPRRPLAGIRRAAGPARADAPARLPARHEAGRGRRPRAPRGAGPDALGPGRRSRKGRRWSRRPFARGRRGRMPCRPRSPRCTRRRRARSTPTGRRSRRSTPCCTASSPRRSSSSIARSRSRWPTARRADWRSSTSSRRGASSPAITWSTQLGPICCEGSGGARRRTRPMHARIALATNDAERRFLRAQLREETPAKSDA